MKRTTVLLLLAGLAALGFSGCNDSAKSGGGGSGSPLRVGMELTYPPFEMQDNQGNPDGVGVRMAEELAKYLGRPLKIVPMGFDGLPDALKNGSIDCIISSMTVTDHRRETLDFSDPYAFTSIAMLAGKNSDVNSVEDLKKPGRKVAVKLSTTGETWARANLPDSGVVVFDQQDACVEEVAAGRADAFVYDQLSIYRSAKQKPDTTRALLQPIQEEGWAVALKKGDDALRTQVNEFLKKFRAEGGFGKLADRYLGEEKKVLEGLGIPFILR